MPTITHTLEGPDLEALLARVPAELGAGATIVAANKLRSGGLGGFFTKEAFEVVVEVPEPDAAAPAPEVAPRGDLSLGLESVPRMSTEAVGFAGVLDRMVRDAGIEDTAPRTVGPALHRPGRPLSAGSSDSALGAMAEPPEPPEPFEPFEPLLPGPTDRRIAPAVHARHVSVSTPGAPRPAAPVRSSGVASPALDQRWLTRVGIPANLAHHLTTISHDPAVELYHLMDRLELPEPLPTHRGSVIAVVGRRADAMELAEAFAAELGTNPDDILVAAPSFRGSGVVEARRVNSVDLALERRRGWRRAHRPTIIAVEASLGRRRSTWATHLLDAVEPTMVWGVVEASRKAEDIRDWAERLGGLDALAVTDLDDTVSPAAVLGAGVPVGLLDGSEATASRWTAILAEHLELAA